MAAPTQGPSPERLIEQTLESVLIRMNKLEDERREHERSVTRLRNSIEGVEAEANRLQRALLTLQGMRSEPSDAQKANSKMRQELRQARR
jgi:phage shock protein A